MSRLANLSLRSFAHRVVPGEGSDPGVDVAAFAVPFAGDRPSGESLRYEGTYDRIRAARQEEDPNLPQGIWQTAVKVADWKGVKTLCLDALATESKDLQIAAWLTESLARLHGFGGLAIGLELLSALCEQQWSSLHPELDDDGDADARLNCFVWVNEAVSLSVSRLPLTQVEDCPAFSFADLEAASPDVDDEDDLLRDGKKTIPTLGHILEALELTPSGYIQACYGGCARAVQALDRLEEALAARLDHKEQPGFGRLRRVLDGALDKLRRPLEARGIPLLKAEPTAEPEEHMPEIQPEESRTPSPDHFQTMALPSRTGEAAMPEETVLRGPIRSRDEAFEALAEAADFLSRTEPHSPVPYLIRRAIRWGGMPLTDLLVELLEEGHDRMRLMDMLDMTED